jgi:uncharacterized protein (TIGR02145 family)
VSIRLTFKKGGSSGPLVYCALHQDVSNANGFISLQLNRNVLGTGCNGAPSTTFETIPWKEGGFWMEVEYQTVPNTPFTSLGQLELASSFYAFAAGSAEKVNGVRLDGANNGDVLSYNLSTGQWEPKPSGSGLPTGTTGTMLVHNGTSWTVLPAGRQGHVLTFCHGKPNWGPCNFNLSLLYGTMSDIDGNTYKTIEIGTQTWMAENLKVSKYRDGTSIPTGLDGTTWQAATTGAYSIYDDDVLYNNDSATNTTYGKLYNWYAVVDSRNLCPVGWHVPSDAELTNLKNFIGGDPGGRKLISTSSLWTAPNYSTNESGFSGLPGGYRTINGTYQHVSNSGHLWSTTETTAPFSRLMNAGGSFSTSTIYGKRSGLSVRCLKD